MSLHPLQQQYPGCGAISREAGTIMKAPELVELWS